MLAPAKKISMSACGDLEQFFCARCASFNFFCVPMHPEPDRLKRGINDGIF